MFDLVFRNGSVIDGTGSPAYTADVAVKDGEIAAIGRIEGESAKTIDAAGLAITPGFIDLHTHSDLSFLLDPTAQSKVRQGVTLELTGNCGMSFCAPLIGEAEEQFRGRMSAYTDSFEPSWTDFGGYIDAVERAGSTLNVAFQVGHGTIRTCIVGQEDRAPTGDELDRMVGLVGECLDGGAMGFSTGLFYAPGNYARLEEVIALAQAAADRGRVYSTHMRDEGAGTVGLFVAINEAIEVGRRTGVRVQVSHVKCIGDLMWGRAADALSMFEEARREGIDVAGDQYPYTASSTSLTGAMFPRWALSGGREATLARMADGAQRDRMLTDIASRFEVGRGPDATVIARYVPQERYEGMTVGEIATDMEVSPAEAVLSLYYEAEASVISHGMQEDDVETIAKHPLISVASDGTSLSAEGVLSQGLPHPRSYGTNPRYLSHYQRERGLVSLPEAIRKMTTLPAQRLGLTRRGRIAPGFAADLVALDPDTVADTATFEAPHSYPVGVPHVAVNGVLAVEDGEYTGKTPGRVIRDFSD